MDQKTIAQRVVVNIKKMEIQNTQLPGAINGSKVVFLTPGLNEFGCNKIKYNFHRPYSKGRLKKQCHYYISPKYRVFHAPCFFLNDSSSETISATDVVYTSNESLSIAIYGGSHCTLLIFGFDLINLS